MSCKDGESEEEELNYGGRLDGMSQQERGRLWGKLKTGGTGDCIQKRALLSKLSRMPKLARKISRSVYLGDKVKKSIVDELREDVEKDPKGKLSLSEFVRWLDPRPREKKKKSSSKPENDVKPPTAPPMNATTTTTTTTNTTSTTTSKIVLFTCRRCRFRLFTMDDLESHQIGKHNFDGVKSSSSTQSRSKCHSVFVKEPPKWMDSETTSSASAHRINCPKCNAKVGNASWIGTQCSCGTWVTPAFQFSKAKIDAKRRRRRQKKKKL